MTRPSWVPAAHRVFGADDRLRVECCAGESRGSIRSEPRRVRAWRSPSDGALFQVRGKRVVNGGGEMPNSSATRSGGARNCQTETPCARASRRVRACASGREAPTMEPNRTAKGRICSATAGVRNRASCASSPVDRSGHVAGAAHELDEVQRVDEHETVTKTPEMVRTNCARQVAPEGEADHMPAPVSPPPRRGRGPERGAGATRRARPGSARRHPERDRAGEQRRHRRGARPSRRAGQAGEANPAIRTRPTATMAAPIAAPRPWRVVRGVPSAAKAIANMAKRREGRRSGRAARCGSGRRCPGLVETSFTSGWSSIAVGRSRGL